MALGFDNSDAKLVAGAALFPFVYFADE